MNPAAMTERLIDAAVYAETATGVYVSGARKEVNEARSAIEIALTAAAQSRAIENATMRAAAEARASAAEAREAKAVATLNVPSLSEVPAAVVVAMGKRLGIFEPFNEMGDDDIAAMFRDGLEAFIRARATLSPETQVEVKS